jgi:hypothetical protein
MNDDLRADYERRLKALEAFGHRGSASENEAKAAEYLTSELGDLGLEVHQQPFRGCSSLGARLVLHTGIALLGTLLLWAAPAVTLVLVLLALSSLILEHSTRVLLLSRPLVNRPSTNVVARIPASSDPAKHRLVVLAHYDTQRTGWIWNGALLERLAPIFAKSPGMTKSPIFPILAAMVAATLAALVATLWGTSWFVWLLGAPSAFVLLVASVLLAQWARGPYVPGAMDNASGTAAVLTLAEAWLADPKDDVELVLLLTGCEETGLLGATAFAAEEAKGDSDPPTSFLNIDTLGAGDVRFLGREHTLAGLPVDYPADLVALSSELAQASNLASAGPRTLPVASDAIPFLLRGIPGMSVLSFEDDGHMANYHQLTDTSDRLSFDGAWEAVRFSWDLLKALARR